MFVTQGDLVQCFLMDLSEPNPANLRQWSQQAKKRKRKKQKKDRKQTEEQNFLALGDLVRSSNKVFIESNSFRSWLASFFAPTAAYMMEWLRDKVMWQRLTKMRYFLSRKGQESVVFVEEEFLHKKINKKDVFGYLTTNSLRKVTVKQNDLWRLVKVIR